MLTKFDVFKMFFVGATLFLIFDFVYLELFFHVTKSILGLSQ